MQNHPPGALKSPENPAIPNEIYDMVLNPDPPQASTLIDIPPKNPLAQSSVFADLAKGAHQRNGSSLNRNQRKYY
jgi:hypothetical protein